MTSSLPQVPCVPFSFMCRKLGFFFVYAVHLFLGNKVNQTEIVAHYLA